jgi:hypothetical protein
VLFDEGPDGPAAGAFAVFAPLDEDFFSEVPEDFDFFFFFYIFGEWLATIIGT